MPKFKIDEIEYDTDDLSQVQTRVVGLYQKALRQESEALNDLEVARAARIEIGRKLKEMVIDQKAGQSGQSTTPKSKAN